MKRIVATVLLLIMLGLPALAAADGPEAALRNGTLVIRIPRGWLIEQIKKGVISGTSWDGVDKDAYDANDPDDAAEIQRIVKTFLGSAAAGYLDDCWDGNAPVVDGYWALGYTSQASDITMAQQYMDGAWYTISRLSPKDQSRRKLFCDGSHFLLGMKDGILHFKWPVYGCTELDIAPERLEAQKPFYQGKNGNVRVSLYRAFDATVAVLTAPHVDQYTLWNAKLLIDGNEPSTVVNRALTGYRTRGDNGVYCVMVSQGEAEAIMRGAELKITEAELTP